MSLQSGLVCPFTSLTCCVCVPSASAGHARAAWASRSGYAACGRRTRRWRRTAAGYYQARSFLNDACGIPVGRGGELGLVSRQQHPCGALGLCQRRARLGRPLRLPVQLAVAPPHVELHVLARDRGVRSDRLQPRDPRVGLWRALQGLLQGRPLQRSRQGAPRRGRPDRANRPPPHGVRRPRGGHVCVLAAARTWRACAWHARDVLAPLISACAHPGTLAPLAPLAPLASLASLASLAIAPRCGSASSLHGLRRSRPGPHSRLDGRAASVARVFT